MRLSNLTDLCVRVPTTLAVAGTEARPCAACRPSAGTAAVARTRQFDALLRGFAHTGGVAPADDVARLLRAHIDQPISRLARWIVRREVLGFAWQATMLVPMFQFATDALVPHPAVASVLGELGDLFDDWELAAWFAQANDWLGEDSPADRMQRDPDAVLQAARADRYVACG